MSNEITRRTFVGGVAGAAGAAAFGGSAFAQLALPKSPVTLKVFDPAVAGATIDLARTYNDSFVKKALAGN